MRTGQLKSLLAVLRAAGVSEFSDSKSGVSLKLGSSVPVAATGKKKPAEKTEVDAQAELVSSILADSRAQKELQRLGVDAETAARELADVA